eukprot:Hpha_TRINITY_DN31635_c0_g1::TRINITY_DN31635_c0_g1_i1::g.29105::m.29105
MLLVYVRTLAGETAAVEVSPDGSVGDLLAELRRLPALTRAQGVRFGGSLLDPGAALADTGLSNESVVEVVTNALQGAELVARGQDTSVEDIVLKKVEGGWGVTICPLNAPSGVSSYGGVCVSDKVIDTGVAMWSVKIEEKYRDEELEDNISMGVFTGQWAHHPLAGESSGFPPGASPVGIMEKRATNNQGKFVAENTYIPMKEGEVVCFEYNAEEATLSCTSPSGSHTWTEVPPPVRPMVSVTYPGTRITLRFD